MTPSYFTNIRSIYPKLRQSLAYRETEPLSVWVLANFVAAPITIITSICEDVKSLSNVYQEKFFTKGLKKFYDNYSEAIKCPIPQYYVDPTNSAHSILISEQNLYIFNKEKITVLIEPLEWLERIKNYIVARNSLGASSDIIVTYKEFDVFNNNFNILFKNLTLTPLNPNILKTQKWKSLSLRFNKNERLVNWPTKIHFIYDWENMGEEMKSKYEASLQQTLWSNHPDIKKLPETIETQNCSATPQKKKAHKI